MTDDQTGQYLSEPCTQKEMEENTVSTTTSTNVSSVYSADPNLTYYLSTIPRVCLEVFGIISNIINLIVLNNRKMQGCFNTLLIGLTWGDFFLTANSLPVDIWAVLNRQSHQTIANWPFIAKFYYFFFVFTMGNTCFGASSIITCSIMIFRFTCS